MGANTLMEIYFGYQFGEFVKNREAFNKLLDRLIAKDVITERGALYLRSLTNGQ